METSYTDQLPIVNRTYKDTLFRMIFREKRNLLQLYNALNGTNYIEEADLEIVTLENAIYMNMKNWLDRKIYIAEKNYRFPIHVLSYFITE